MCHSNSSRGKKSSQIKSASDSTAWSILCNSAKNLSLFTLFIAILFSQLSAEAQSPKPNVLLITIDTLRADRLGCYGYSAAKTPIIDRLAAEGVRFTNAASHAPLTRPSHTTIFTG